MDFKDQLKNLFPDHIPIPEEEKEKDRVVARALLSALTQK